MQYHPHLTQKEWNNMPLAQQMANIGSEVMRAYQWKEKGNLEYSQLAGYRALELAMATVNSQRNHQGLKEITRMKECIADALFGDNQYNSTKEQWDRYFLQYTYLARNK